MSRIAHRRYVVGKIIEQLVTACHGRHDLLHLREIVVGHGEAEFIGDIAKLSNARCFKSHGWFLLFAVAGFGLSPIECLFEGVRGAVDRRFVAMPADDLKTNGATVADRTGQRQGRVAG